MNALQLLAGWRNTVARRVHEREVRRQMLYNRGRKITHKYLSRLVPKRPSTLSGEFLRMWLGSVAAFWIIARLLAYVPHVNSQIVLLLVGLLFSMQASFYRHRILGDPNYKIPKCGTCGNRKDDNTETVLRSRDSTLLGISNSWFGVGFYIALLVFAIMKYPAAIYLAGAGVLASVYFSYLMIAKIKALCALCINTVALNLVIFLQILFRFRDGAFHP